MNVDDNAVMLTMHSKILNVFRFELVCMITKYRPKLHISTVKISIDFGLDQASSSIIFVVVKSIFHTYMRCFVSHCIVQWDGFMNISETIAGYWWNRSPLLTELTFCHKSSMNISIDNRYCNRFIHLWRPIFPMNHNGSSRCLQSRSHLVSHMRLSVLHSRSTGHPNCDWGRIVATQQLDSFTVPSTHYVSNNCIYFQSHLFAGTNSVAIDSITMKYWYFFLCIAHQQSAISCCWLLWLPVIAKWLQKICRIKISLQFISTFGCNITLTLDYLRPVTVFQLNY